MDEVPDLAAVKDALAAAGISVARLCRRADLAESTWHRWTLCGVEPRSKNWQKVVEALRALQAEQAAQAEAAA